MESKNVLNPPSFFVSMATAAKFIQPIPIFLVYLAPLDVDVVSYQVSSISVSFAAVAMEIKKWGF
jgi:hypothetical protein